MSDLGVALCKTGNSITHNRNRPHEYVKAKFVKNVDGSNIVFSFDATHDNILDNVTVEQGWWRGKILSQLSDQQIRDAFRAASYSPEEIDMLTQICSSTDRRTD